MKNSLLLSLALAGPLMTGAAFAQGSGKNVTVFRMAGPRLGVQLEEVDADVASRLKLKEEKGALVTEVLDDSAALKAGIKKDDVIVRFQGESILTAAQLSRLVREVPSGRKVDLELIRGGSPLKVTATLERAEWSGDFGPDMEAWNKEFGETLGKKLGKLGENLGDLRLKTRPGRPNAFIFKEGPGTFAFKNGDGGAAWTVLSGLGKPRLGITYSEIEGQLASYFKSPKDQAVLVNSVVEGSAAEKAGLKAGDLLVKVGDTSIEDASDLQKAVADLSPGKPTPVAVWRAGHSVDLSVTLEEDAKAKTTRPRRPVS